MILVGLGSNIDGPWGDPHASVQQALQELNIGPIRLVRHSSLIDTDPYGRKNQPRYVNAVAIIATHLPPEALMRRLLDIEIKGGRKRRLRWGPRTIDLDLLDYHGLRLRCNQPRSKALILPHPEILKRDFVLGPIAEIAPNWIHPVIRVNALLLHRRLLR
jgi:2-amino-4-hydroxy-6-hydroxymethyldihydropteridine diphosphokinase